MQPFDEKYPFYTPLYMMAKPAGPACNLSCRYCYYLEKSSLPGMSPQCMMSDEVLARFISSYIAAQSGPCVQFIWHGGEAMMRGIAFYERVMELQRRYAGGMEVVNSIQTNGTLLTDEWCRFLRRNGWLTGISIDGPQHIHDAYRYDRSGRGSFLRTLNGIRMLQRHGVEWNALATVNNLNVKEPEEFYTFFKDLGCRYLQFTPIVERRTSSGNLADVAAQGEVTAESVTPAEWGEFLCAVFDLWVRSDVGKVFVQLFDATLANWVGAAPGLCTMGTVCGHAGVMEYNGDVYSCDHFVFPQYRLGNVMHDSIVAMMGGEAQARFAAMKTGALPQKCRGCEYLFACNGECPKNRFGADGLNYLCEGYRRYFGHVAPYMDFMAAELRAGRAPANVMRVAGKL